MAGRARNASLPPGRNREKTMSRDDTQPRSLAMSLLAASAAALAIGAVAVGAIAIGRIVIGRLTASRVRLHSVGIDDLTIKRLRVLESEPDEWYAQEK